MVSFISYLVTKEREGKLTLASSPAPGPRTLPHWLLLAAGGPAGPRGCVPALRLAIVLYNVPRSVKIIWLVMREPTLVPTSQSPISPQF